MIRCHIAIAVIIFYVIAMAIADDIAKRPLVLEKVFLQHINNKYEYPKSIKKIEHMSGGVSIMRFNSQLVQYFCPAETEKEINAERNELWSKCVFGTKNLRNTCQKEIQPIAKKGSDKNNSHIDCGMGDNEGKLYNIGYQYCFTSDETISTPSLTRKKAPEEFKSNFLNIMDLCYDHSKKKTLYVTHKLYSPKIFQSELMDKDELSWKTEWKIDNYGIFEDDFKNMETTIEKYLNEFKEKVQLTKTPLAWPGDMAFASGKKAFYHYSNIVLTPPAVSDLMEKVTNYIRKTAIDKKLGEITIHSGSYEYTFPKNEFGPSYPEDIKQYAPSYLWHIVLNEKKTLGIAVILRTSDYRSYAMKKICHSDICYSNGWIDMMRSVPSEYGGSLYCCTVTETVNELKLIIDGKDLSKVEVLKLK